MANVVKSLGYLRFASSEAVTLICIQKDQIDELLQGSAVDQLTDDRVLGAIVTWLEAVNSLRLAEPRDDDAKYLRESLRESSIRYTLILHHAIKEELTNYVPGSGKLRTFLLDKYLRCLKALCKSEIYKSEDGQLLELWSFYLSSVCPIVANDLPVDIRYTGKYFFTAMHLKSDLGITAPELPRGTFEKLSKMEEHDVVGEEFNLINGVKDRLKQMKVPYEMEKQLGKTFPRLQIVDVAVLV